MLSTKTIRNVLRRASNILCSIDPSLFIWKDVWIKNPLSDSEEDVLHIFSAIDLKKMIPVVDTVIKEVNINFDDNDTIEEKLYKDLLQNEYNFCLKIIDDIIIRANKVYDKQVRSKNGLRFCCDFKALEKYVDQCTKRIKN